MMRSLALLALAPLAMGFAPSLAPGVLHFPRPPSVPWCPASKFCVLLSRISTKCAKSGRC